MSDPDPVTKLEEPDVQRALVGLPRWRRVDDQLQRTFEFPDFVAAFAFMTSVALIAERMGHHPEWSNVYGTVRVALTTHDVGGLSARDLELAGAIDHLPAAVSLTGVSAGQ